MDTPELFFGRSPDGRSMRLASDLWLPHDRATVFKFFSDAHQLETLTPAWLNFAVLTPRPLAMREGLLIDYRLRLRGVPLRWQSRIEAWEPPLRFIDVQTRGPYRWWRHEHLFEERDGGTLCRDIVDYAVPGGTLVERLLVRPDLQKIFAFRREKLRELFGEPAHACVAVR